MPYKSHIIYKTQVEQGFWKINVYSCLTTNFIMFVFFKRIESGKGLQETIKISDLRNQ